MNYEHFWRGTAACVKLIAEWTIWVENKEGLTVVLITELFRKKIWYPVTTLLFAENPANSQKRMNFPKVFFIDSDSILPIMLASLLHSQIG